MTPKSYMVIGSVYGVVFAVMVFLLPGTTPVSSVCVFATGALFGKGYGIWEERARRSSRPPISNTDGSADA